MASLKDKPPKKRSMEEEEERERSERTFGTKDFTMVNRSADVIFDAAWSLVKGEYPVAEFGGNTECKDCGSDMRQATDSLGHGYPTAYGFICDKCGYFMPHDMEYATTPKPTLICPECKGTGEQKTYNRKRDSYECQMCNGTGKG